MYVCLGWQIPEGGDSSCQISRGGDEKGGQMPRPPTLQIIFIDRTVE